MKITRSTTATRIGPAEWFTGHVYVDAISPEGAGFGGGVVHFAPGARTNWHTHALGQMICITEGVGRVQREGGPIEEVHVGDVVFFEPNENHWHGAAPDRFMAHIAIVQQPAEGDATIWGAAVTDDEYKQS